MIDVGSSLDEPLRQLQVEVLGKHNVHKDSHTVLVFLVDTV